VKVNISKFQHPKLYLSLNIIPNKYNWDNLVKVSVYYMKMKLLNKLNYLELIFM